jgi:surface protein
MQNFNSEIQLVINGNGLQNFLSSSFYTEPSDVIVNGISKKNICSRTCELEDSINYITLKFEEEIVSFENMFNGLTNIKEVDLTNFDTSKVTNMKSMFESCSNLEKITLGNIDTSLVNDMERLFANCVNLRSIDVSNFDTTQVTNLKEMFLHCESIRVVDASSFRTPKLESVYDMFGYCYNLIAVNVSNMDTSNVQIFQGMFFGCLRLKFIDLSNLDISKGTNLHFMFGYCDSLVFLNIKSFKMNNNITDIYNLGYYHFQPYFRLCIEDTVTKSYLFGDVAASDCTHDCFEENKRVDITTNLCVDECDRNLFEYKRVCNNLCLEGDSVIYNNEKVCFEKAPENYYLNTNDWIYRKCFNRCQKCQIAGDNSDNNCDKCFDDYKFVPDSLLKEKNCYEKCEFYYYLDEFNNYYCTLYEFCPENYKLIKEKKKMH